MFFFTKRKKKKRESLLFQTDWISGVSSFTIQMLQQCIIYIYLSKYKYVYVYIYVTRMYINKYRPFSSFLFLSDPFHSSVYLTLAGITRQSLASTGHPQQPPLEYLFLIRINYWAMLVQCLEEKKKKLQFQSVIVLKDQRPYWGINQKLQARD